jgi:hypothetical protein
MGDGVFRLTWLASVMSLGHHLDDLVRGNAVGWPVTDQVNAFTASLVVYPIIATGLVPTGPAGSGPGSGPWSRAAGPSLSAWSTSARPRSNHPS